VVGYEYIFVKEVGEEIECSGAATRELFLERGFGTSNCVFGSGKYMKKEETKMVARRHVFIILLTQRLWRCHLINDREKCLG
jgi:hypothetical protein